MFKKLILNSCCALALVVAAAGSALAQPTLEISSTRVEPGEYVLMTIAGFVPGGYQGTMFMDGVPVLDLDIYPGGSRTFAWLIPEDLSPGGHDFWICAACDQGDIEERTNTVRVTVIGDTELTGAEFNLQVWGVEVTQGVRADFAVRTPPSGSLDLPDETVVHVANRRTVVRVYPWVEGGPDFTSIRNIDLNLWVTRDGTTHGPYRALFPMMPEVRADATLAELRSDLNRTWNFRLPPEVLQVANSETAAAFDLTVTINPDAPWQRSECETCADDNTVTLNSNDMRHVGVSNNYAMKFRPHLVEAYVEQEDESIIFVERPTAAEMAGAIRTVYDVLPIADGNRGVRLMPWRNVDWEGTQEEWDPKQDEFLIENYLPGGELHAAPANDYYAFMYWEAGGCAGHAFLNSPFLRTAACDAPSYVAAHELNHAIGAAHAGNGHGEDDGGGFDASYPGEYGQIEPETWGLDVYTMQLHPPRNPINENFAHDFMSYAGTDEWVSRYTWDLAAENLGTPEIDPGKRSLPFPATAPEKSGVLGYVAFRGRFDPAGQLDLAPFFGSWAPDGGQGDGTYQLEFTDANGAVLAAISPRLNRYQDLDQGLGLFAEAIALPLGWDQMILREGNDVVQAWSRGSNPPQVTLLSPAPEFQWANTGDVTLSWAGSDPDGDDLIYRVLAKHNVDDEVFILASGLTSESFVLDRSTLPAGGVWSVLVEVSDGFDCASSIPVDGWVEPMAPQVVILEPAPGSVFVAGQDVPTMGLVADLQGEIPDGDVKWYLHGNEVGVGTSCELSNVTVGTHELELSVTNAHQLVGNATLQIEVVSELAPPVQTAPVDGATTVARPVRLDWEPVAGAISYRLQVSYDPGFTGLVGEVGNVTGTEGTFDPPPGDQPIYWRVMAEHGSAPSDWSPTHSFAPVGQPAAVDDTPALRGLDLNVFPNPFNPSTTVAFDLARAGRVTVEVYDLAGRRVRTLTDGQLAEGRHTVAWNGQDDRGLSVGSGVYLVRLVSPQGTVAKRVLLLK